MKINTKKRIIFHPSVLVGAPRHQASDSGHLATSWSSSASARTRQHRAHKFLSGTCEPRGLPRKPLNGKFCPKEVPFSTTYRNMGKTMINNGLNRTKSEGTVVSTCVKKLNADHEVAWHGRWDS